MVLLIARNSVALCRLPRPRGDGPRLLTHAGLVHGVAPPARGWSRVVHRNAQRPAGCPARAGMVRRSAAPPRSPPRLPRPRGDGPNCPRLPSVTGGVAPPARGWSRYRTPASPLVRGCPARAGMVPEVSRERAVPARLPRPRGDDCGREAGCPAPPAQIRTCPLRHPAPPLGRASGSADGEASIRPRVSDFQPGPVSRGQAVDTGPSCAVLLRSVA